MTFLSQSLAKLTLGAALMGCVLTGGLKPAIAASLSESEFNDLPDSATILDGYFSHDSNPDIGLSNFYKTASVNGKGFIDETFDPEDFDFFSFTVAQAGIEGIFDIDRTKSTLNIACQYNLLGDCEAGSTTTDDIGFDTFLGIFDASENLLSLLSDDELVDAGSVANSPSSGQSLDALLRYIFPKAGTYYVGVGFKPLENYRSQEGEYTLHASLSTQPIPTPALLPGIVGLMGAIVRKRSRSIE